MKIILVTYDIRKTKSHGSVTFMSPRLLMGYQCANSVNYRCFVPGQNFVLPGTMVLP